MEANEVVMWVVGGSALIVVYAHGRWASRERSRLKGRVAELEQERDQAVKDAVQSAEQAKEGIETACESLRLADEKRKAAEIKAREQTQRADRQFHYIEDTIHERDGIWQMYRAAVLGAGNAQDLLFKEIQRVYRFCHAAGKKYSFDPIEPSKDLQRVLGSFQSTHRDEGAAKQGVQDAKKQIQDGIESRMGVEPVND